MRWIQSLDEVQAGADSAWVWTVDRTQAEALRITETARVDASDLADAAALGIERGASRLRARLLLRALSAGALGCDVGEVVMARNDAGRPRVTGPKPLFASVARRGCRVLLAVGPRPLGVDVEDAPAAPPLPVDLLPKAIRGWVGSCATRFSRAWCAYEACSKAEGSGLAGSVQVGERLQASDAGLAYLGHSVHFVEIPNFVMSGIEIVCAS